MGQSDECHQILMDIEVVRKQFIAEGISIVSGGWTARSA